MAVKRILPFLKGTIAHGLHFRKGSFIVTACLDVDWAGDPDGQRFTFGYTIFIGPNLILECQKATNSVTIKHGV